MSSRHSGTALEMRGHVASCPKCKHARTLAEMCELGVDVTLARLDAAVLRRQAKRFNNESEE